MSDIKDVRAREIIDSRGNPTIEAEVILSNGSIGRASVPSGASTGSREALELRDGDNKRFGGKGVLKAISYVVKDIKDRLENHEARHQKGIDDLLINLDNTSNKSHLGANTTLAVSMAVARAASASTQVPLYQYLATSASIDLQKEVKLPVPMFNFINGGAHANNGLDIQEFMILPIGAPTFFEAVRFGSEIFQALKSYLTQHHLSTAIGDEGGFAPALKSNEEAIILLLKAIETVGLKAGQDVWLGLDVASSEFYEQGQYHLHLDKKSLSSEEMIAYLHNWVTQYPIVSIEDGMAEEDWSGWKLLTERLGDRIQLVGDDIFVTNTNILKEGIKEGIANSILIKPNQIGTLTETLAAVQMAVEARYTPVISHRSGETEDTFIADLAVAWQIPQIKAGALSRTDRVAKYNQLIRIEESLGDRAHYCGRKAFKFL